MNIKDTFFMVIHDSLFTIHRDKEFGFIQAVFDEFGLNKNNYLSVKNDIDMRKIPEHSVSGSKGLFEYVPILHFYYDVTMDICKQDDYANRIANLAKEFVPDNFTLKADTKVNHDGALFILSLLSETGMIKFANTIHFEYNKTISSYIEEALEIEDLDNNVIFNKYIVKQEKKLFEFFKTETEFNEDTLYRFIARLVFKSGKDISETTDVVAGMFGYSFDEGDLDFIFKNLDIIGKVVKEEIKKYLLDKLDEAEYNDNPLKITQINIQAGIEEKHILPVIHFIKKSCEEYLYLREIANLQRKQVIEEIFGKKNVIESNSNPSKEVSVLQQEKENLLSENALLLHKIESLTKEVESLKKTLANKDKEFEGVLREKQAEHSKELKEKDAFIEFAKEHIVGWANWWFLKSATPETENDTEVKPYDIAELQQKRMLIVGGRSERINKLRELLPKSVFITSETDKIPTGEFDLVFFFNNFMNHAMYEKCVKKAREQKINMGYTLCTNVEKTLSDINEGLKGSKVLTY